MDSIKLTHNALSVNDALDAVTADKCGAVSIFVGTTRDNFEGKKVISLEYEAYNSMAETVIKQICNEIRNKWTSIQNIAIYHRLGKVEVKESSVIIAISSPHRKDAMEATQWCIDKLKETVPIWKKEMYENQQFEWKENIECTWSKNKNINKTKFEFKPKFECPNLSSHFIQVNCSNIELERRINTFIKRKRVQINISNIRDFCGKDFKNSSARIQSISKRAQNMKSHLQSEKVYNHYAPYNVHKRINTTNNIFISSAIEERVSTIENNIDVENKPVSRNIYDRLKNIEEKLFFLETLSPEYALFWNKNSIRLKNKKELKKSTFSMQDIDHLLYDLEKQKHIKNIT